LPVFSKKTYGGQAQAARGIMEGKMSEDRINAMKEFVAFLKRKKGMDVSGDLYIDHVNFLFSETAALRATLA